MARAQLGRSAVCAGPFFGLASGASAGAGVGVAGCSVFGEGTTEGRGGLTDLAGVGQADGHAEAKGSFNSLDDISGYCSAS